MHFFLKKIDKSFGGSENCSNAGNRGSTPRTTTHKAAR